MATLITDSSQTEVERVVEGDPRKVRTFRDGSVVMADWIQALVLEGRVHGVQTGTATTPDTFNAAYADAQQDLYIHVPAGTVIMPLYIGIGWEGTSTAGLLDCFAAYSSNGDASVTGDALTVYNFKTLASPSTACTATAVVTGGGATHLGGTDFLEFWRPYAGFHIDAAGASIAHLGGGTDSLHGMFWSAKDSIAPVIGSAGTACALSIFASAVGGTGYITAVWAELPASALA